MLWGWGNTANKYHWHVWGVLAVFQPHGVCPHSWPVCFPGLHCSDSRLLCQELSEVGPGLHAFPRSKPLRFRFSSTPQRCRLGWGCVLCPSQVRAAQVTRCLESAHSPGVVHLITSPVPATRFPGCAAASQVCCASLLGTWSLAVTLLTDVNHPGSQEDLVSSGSLLTFWWRMPSLGPRLPLPSGSGCRLPASLPPVGMGWSAAS